MMTDCQRDPVLWFENLCVELSKRPKEVTRILEEFRESESVFKTALAVLQTPNSTHLAKFHALSSVQYALLVKWESISTQEKSEWLKTIEQFIFQAVTQQYPSYITNKLIQVFSSLQKRQWLLSSFEEKESLFTKLLQFFPTEFPSNQPVPLALETYNEQVMSTKLGINLILSLLEEFSKRSSADIGIYGEIYIQRKENFEKSFLPSLFPFFIKLLTQQLPLWVNFHQHLHAPVGGQGSNGWLDVPSNFRFSAMLLPEILKTLSELLTWQYNEKSTTSSSWSDAASSMDGTTIYYPLASYANPLLDRDFIKQLFYLLHILVQSYFQDGEKGHGHGSNGGVTINAMISQQAHQLLAGKELVLRVIQELKTFLSLLSLLSGDIFTSSSQPSVPSTTNSPSGSNPLAKTQYGLLLLSCLYPMIQPHLARGSLSLLTIDADDFHATATTSARTFYLELYTTLVHNFLFNNTLVMMFQSAPSTNTTTTTGASSKSLYEEGMEYVQCVGYIMHQLLEELNVITNDIQVTLIRSNFQDIDFFSSLNNSRGDRDEDDDGENSSAHLYSTWRFELILAIMDIFVMIKDQFPVHSLYYHAISGPSGAAGSSSSSSSSDTMITSYHYHFYAWIFHFVQQTFPLFYDLFLTLSLVDTLQDMEDEEDEDEENIYLQTIEQCMHGITCLGKMNLLFAWEYMTSQYLVPTVQEWEKVVQTSARVGMLNGGGSGNNAFLASSSLLSPASISSQQSSHASMDHSLAWARRNVYCLEKLRLTIWFFSSMMVDNYQELVKKSSTNFQSSAPLSDGEGSGGEATTAQGKYVYELYLSLGEVPLINAWLLVNLATSIRTTSLQSHSNTNSYHQLVNHSLDTKQFPFQTLFPSKLHMLANNSTPAFLLSFASPQHQQLIAENRQLFVQSYSLIAYLLSAQMMILNGSYAGGNTANSAGSLTPVPAPMSTASTPTSTAATAASSSTSSLVNKDCVSPYLLQMIYRFYSVSFLYYLDVPVDEYSSEYQQLYSPLLQQLIPDDINNVLEKIVNSWIVLIQYYPLEIETVKTSCEVMVMLLTRPSTTYLPALVSSPAIQYLLSQFTLWYQYVYTFYAHKASATHATGIFGGSNGQSIQPNSILTGLTPEGWMMISEVLSKLLLASQQMDAFRLFCETIYKVMEVIKPSSSAVSAPTNHSSATVNHIIHAEQMMIKKQLLACLTGLAKSPVSNHGEETVLHTVYGYFWTSFYGNPMTPNVLLTEGEKLGSSLDELLHLYTALLIQYTEHQLQSLGEQDNMAQSLYTTIAILFYTYSVRFSTLYGVKSQSLITEQITFIYDSCTSLLNIMNAIALKDFFLSSDTTFSLPAIQMHASAAATSSSSSLHALSSLQTIPSVLYYGLQILMPFLTEDCLCHYPLLSEKYFSYVVFLCSTYLEVMLGQWIASMTEAEGLKYWDLLLSQLVLGITVVDSAVARMALQALQLIAANQCKASQGNASSSAGAIVGTKYYSHYQRLLQAFQQILHLIFASSSASTNKLTPDRLDALANTVITMIVMDPNAFQQFISDYLAQQTMTTQTLLRQYLTTLITDRQVSMTTLTKPNRQLFVFNFRDFINHIKSLGLR